MPAPRRCRASFRPARARADRSIPVRPATPTDGAHSSTVDAGGLRWHVEGDFAPGGAPEPRRPRLLLVHGTGASTHTWRGLAPQLGAQAEWLAMDLPGHAATSMPAPSGLSLPAMARSLAALLGALDWQPDAAVGHSAGAAIVVRMALDGSLPGATLGAINGAFLPYGGWLAPVFGPLARMLHGAGWVARLFARRAADPAVVERLVEGTGSRLDAEGLALYGRLMRDPRHTAAALGMMAHWDLRGLLPEMHRLRTPLHLLVGARDRATPPRQARRVRQAVPSVTLTVLPGLGHLAHEEDPQAVLRWLRERVLAAP